MLECDPLFRRLWAICGPQPRRAQGYVAAMVGVPTVSLLRAAFPALLQDATFSLFYPVVALAAVLGGARAGTLALATAALAANLLADPKQDGVLGAAAVAPTVVFMISGAVVVALAAALKLVVARVSQDHLASKRMLEALPVGVVLVDTLGRVEFANSQFMAATGYCRSELHGQAMERLAPEAAAGGWGEAVRRCLKTGAPLRLGPERETHARRKDGSLMPVEIGLAPFRGFGVEGALVTLADLSQSQVIDRRDIVASEALHRARNVLMIVRALARLTLSERDRKPFIDMLQAVARTQDLLRAPTTAVSLRTILQAELGPFAHRIDDAGCELILSARAAENFTLIVHELTANALKHGALSRPGGRIEATCRKEADGRSFRFIWKEAGGPQVPAPVGRGFGGKILTELASSFAARVELDYAPDGFRYELRAEMAGLCKAAET